jgi:hypothetical protein
LQRLERRSHRGADNDAAGQEKRLGPPSTNECYRAEVHFGRLVALRFLNDPAAALAHFAHSMWVIESNRAGAGPTSLVKGCHWLPIQPVLAKVSSVWYAVGREWLLYRQQ